MFENVSFCQPLVAAFHSPGERDLGALSRLPRNRPNCLTIRDLHCGGGWLSSQTTVVPALDRLRPCMVIRNLEAKKFMNSLQRVRACCLNPHSATRG
jgi:hypothetical protein